MYHDYYPPFRVSLFHSMFLTVDTNRGYNPMLYDGYSDQLVRLLSIGGDK